MTFKAPPPRVLEPAEIGVDNRGRTAPDPEPLAAGRSDPSPRDRRLGHQRLELQRAHRIDRHDDPRRPFAEQRQSRPLLGGHTDRRPDRLRPGHARLGQRHGHTAFRAIVSREREPGADGCLHRPLHSSLHAEIERRQRPANGAVEHPEILAAPQAHRVRPEQRDPMARRFEPLCRQSARVLEHTDDTDDGRGQDRSPTRFIVEGNVAAHYRELERSAGLGDALHRLGKLPQDLRPLRRAEIQTIGDAARPSACAGDVSRRLAHGHGRAAPRIEEDLTAVAIRRNGERPARALDAQDGGVGSGQDERVDADLLIVLAERPLLARDGRRPE